MCKKYLIPSIRDAGEAPVDAVGVVQRVRFLLRRQQPPPGFGVDGGVGVDSVVGEVGYVDERHRNFHSLHHFRHHTHHSLVRSAPPEFPLPNRLCFVEAFAPVRSPPVYASVQRYHYLSAADLNFKKNKKKIS